MAIDIIYKTLFMTKDQATDFLADLGFTWRIVDKDQRGYDSSRQPNRVDLIFNETGRVIDVYRS